MFWVYILPLEDLKMEAAFLQIQQYISTRHNPQVHNHHSHHCYNLKSLTTSLTTTTHYFSPSMFNNRGELSFLQYL
jgi:hypothetical protein